MAIGPLGGSVRALRTPLVRDHEVNAPVRQILVGGSDWLPLFSVAHLVAYPKIRKRQGVRAALVVCPADRVNG